MDSPLTTAFQTLSWDDLRFFLHVGRGGTLTAASQSMSVNHATAFRRLQRLEKDIGIQLVNRSRSGYTLTEAGSELFEVAKNMELQLQAAATQLSRRDAWPGGTVRLTTPDTYISTLVAPVLQHYQHQTKTQVHLHSGDAVLDILKGETDVAIRSGSRPAESLIGKALAQVAVTLYRPRKWRDVTPENWSEYPWIGVDASLSHLASAKWLRRQDLEKAMLFRSNSVLNVFQLARVGAGLAALPCFLGDSDPNLQRIIEPPREWRSPLWLLTRAELRNVPRVKLLIRAISERANAIKPLLEGKDPIKA